MRCGEALLLLFNSFICSFYFIQLTFPSPSVFSAPESASFSSQLFYYCFKRSLSCSCSLISYLLHTALTPPVYFSSLFFSFLLFSSLFFSFLVTYHPFYHIPSLFLTFHLPSLLALFLTYSQMGTAIDGLAVTATNYGESQATDLEVH